MATMVLLQAGQATPYPLTEKEIFIGRHPDCAIQLQSNMVSRRHAKIVKNGTGFVLEDLGSGNGTFLNAKRVTEATPLNHLDRIKLGPMLFRFECEQPQSANRFGSGTAPIPLEIAPEDEDGATIMGSASNAGGFGLLDVRPEAKLKAVLEITRSLADRTEPDTLLPKILDSLFRIFPKADRGCVLLKTGDDGQLQMAAQKHRRPDTDDTVRLSRTVLNRVIEEKDGILSADAANDARFEASESISSLTIRSVMCAPLLRLDGELMGVINLDSQNPANQFKLPDLELLMTVAGQAALSYESARLLVSHLEKERQDSELKIARNVQHALLPESLPDIEGYQFFASYHSALAVGGDYYTVVKLPNNRVAIAFGDVAGKGVPGALVMSRLSSVVETTLSLTDDISKGITTINTHMCAHAIDGRFVTFILAVIDLETNEMSLVNAGHMSPLIRKPDGTVEHFHEETVGIPIGIIHAYDYQIVRRTIAPGETVVIVTDGVDEAMNPAGELYTKERVVEFLKTASSEAETLGTALLEDVRRHAAGRAQNDDITIMTFGRDPE